MKRYWVRVNGPRTSGPFGPDGYVVASHHDVRETSTGGLQIITAAEPDHPRKVRRQSCLVLYPRGDWNKVVIGEILSDH